MLGFDLESTEYFEGAKPEELGITCAATCAENSNPKLYWAKDIFGLYQKQMDPRDARKMADDMIVSDAIILTWNGLHFDWPLLAAACESEEYTEKIKWIAFNRHIDMGFCMVIDKGFMIGLDKAAKALGLSGKTEGMHGDLAPILWYPEREPTTEEMEQLKVVGVRPGTREARELCLEYVGQDAKTTVDVYTELIIQQEVYWVSNSGNPVRNPWVPTIINGRLPKVSEAANMPQARTPWWDDNPFDKAEILEWVLT